MPPMEPEKDKPVITVKDTSTDSDESTIIKKHTFGKVLEVE